jgi:hypothetical protein
MRRVRNYKAEYQRRIARGLALGKSTAAARGHARAGEGLRRLPPRAVSPDDRLERAVQAMRAGKSQRAAARAQHISQERLHRYVKETNSVRRIGRRWVFDTAMAICSRKKVRWIVVAPAEASVIGRYWHAVQRFLDDNNATHLAAYVGRGVRDVKGKFWPFETGENNLRLLDSIGEFSFVEIYRNSAPGEE